MTGDDPMILHVLMRTDVPSYEPGKHMAQSNHAGTHLMWQARQFRAHDTFLPHLEEWLAQGEGFGICLTRAVTYPQMRVALALAHTGGIFHGIILDKTYPVRDGDRMQTLEVETCGYMLARRSRAKPIIQDYPLFRGPVDAP